MAVPMRRRQASGGLLSPRGASLTRRRQTLRVLVAAGQQVDVLNKEQARRLRSIRQAWQDDAWAYRDSIGELRYAERFLANSARRIRFFPAFYNDEDATTPVPITEATAEGLTPAVKQAALDTLARLGGPDGMSRLAARTLANFEIAGECWAVGYDDNDDERWEVRSVDEVRITADGTYELRDLPDGATIATTGSSNGWRALSDFGSEQHISRMWVPHPRFAALADAPLRAMLDICEELLITGRSIRAAGRSRLAGAGILFMPEELDIKIAGQDDDDVSAGDFMSRFTQALVTPIADEGVASAVVPIVVRGPKEYADAIKHILLSRPIDETQAKQRVELLQRLAHGLDLPAEVITGMADLNHWTAWQVDDNTFRHHIEPLVLEDCDAWTQGLLWPSILAAVPNVQRDILRRVVYWYDPTELVTSPDRVKDALVAHDKLIISDAALRKAMGWNDSDAPNTDEMLLRMLRSSRTFPPNIVEGLFHKYAPGLVFPSDKNEPGVTPAGFTPPIEQGGSGSEPSAGTQTPPSPTPAPTPPAPPGPPTSTQPSPAARPGMLASGVDHRRRHARLARRMIELDRDLRSRMQAAASLAMARVLERAGAKLRTKVAKDSKLSAAIDGVRAEFVPRTLGRAVVAALEVDDTELIGDPWDQFYGAWTAQTLATAAQQIDLAADVAGVTLTDADRAAVLAALRDSTESAWRKLSPALSTLATSLLYQPADPAAVVEFDTATLVPTGMIRSALSIAGGLADSLSFAGFDDELRPVDFGEPLGQIATGPIIGGWLSDQGVDAEGYEWLHGPAAKPFEPHLLLDGVQFASFDDDVLANDEGFPDNAYFLPGDHSGCTCDFVPLWVPGRPDVSMVGDETESE